MAGQQHVLFRGKFQSSDRMFIHHNCQCRYIHNPLLLRGRKFDIRVYMLILGGSPWLVLYRDGYVRLCCESYQLASPSLEVHLTNQYQQKKNPLYEQLKEDTVIILLY